jgi:hypothetical protein
LLINYKFLSSYDITLLSVSTIVLLLATLEILITKKQKNIEKFADTTLDIPSILAKYKIVENEEDITEIQTRLIIYLTIFNKTSFNNMGRTWFNMINIGSDGKCSDNDNSKFTFDLSPVFSRSNGIYLGNNRIVGPLSNALNIQFHNTYTIAFACKHGNLLVENKNEEIELIKLYANSPNNNGITMYIEKGSLHTDNNTQVASLMIQYADNPPYECKVDKDHNFINLNKNALTFYFIVKDTDNVRVLMMAEGSSTIYLILKFNISNIDVTFSNKELIMNRLLNWNATIYNFGVYDRALTDEQVSVFYSHIMSEYIKNLDPKFSTILTKYNDSVGLIQSLLKCPYDKTVCTHCSSVKYWNDTNEVMNSSSQCRKSINDYCANNTTNPLCKCWDTSSVLYNTDNCRLYRSIFNGEKNASYDGLNQEDLEYIKSKYGLIWPHECPTTITKPKFIENTYDKYDWNKIKVSLDPNDRTTGADRKVLPLYPNEDDTKTDLENKKTDLENKKTTTKNPNGFEITNYYESNKNIKATQNILDSAKKEQIDLLDSKKGMQLYKEDETNLLNSKKEETVLPQVYNIYNKKALDNMQQVSILNNTKSTQNKINSQPVSQVSDKLSDSLPQSDTFFNKFMKVMLPTQ